MRYVERADIAPDSLAPVESQPEPSSLDLGNEDFDSEVNGAALAFEPAGEPVVAEASKIDESLMTARLVYSPNGGACCQRSILHEGLSESCAEINCVDDGAAVVGIVEAQLEAIVVAVQTAQTQDLDLHSMNTPVQVPRVCLGWALGRWWKIGKWGEPGVVIASVVESVD